MFTVITISLTRGREDSRTEREFASEQEAHEFVKREKEFVKEEKERNGFKHLDVEYLVYP